MARTTTTTLTLTPDTVRDLRDAIALLDARLEARLTDPSCSDADLMRAYRVVDLAAAIENAAVDLGVLD